MKKYLKATPIILPRSNKAKCPIYEMNDKFYVKANKSNVGTYHGTWHKGIEYAEVKEINGNWFLD